MPCSPQPVCRPWDKTRPDPSWLGAIRNQSVARLCLRYMRGPQQRSASWFVVVRNAVAPCGASLQVAAAPISPNRIIHTSRLTIDMTTSVATPSCRWPFLMGLTTKSRHWSRVPASPRWTYLSKETRCMNLQSPRRSTSPPGDSGSVSP